MDPNNLNIDPQAAEEELLGDVTSFNSMLKTVAMQPAEVREQVYANLRPAMSKAIRGQIPEQYDEGFMEASLIATNDPYRYVSEIKEMSRPSPATMDRTNQPFDPSNPVDAQFLDSNGVPSFNNGNWKNYMKTRGVPDDMIEGLDKQSGSDLESMIERMTPQERIAALDITSKIQKSAAEAREKARKDDPLALTEATRSTLQKELSEHGVELSNVRDIAAQTKDEYLTYTTRGINSIQAIKEKINPNLLDDEAKQELEEFNTWKKGVKQMFNVYRKRITGAAAQIAELKDLEEGFVSGKISPTEFKAGISSIERNLSILQEEKYKTLEGGRMRPPTLVSDLEKAGRFASIKASDKPKNPYDNIPNSQILNSLSNLASQGAIQDNDILGAAIEMTRRKNENWDELPDSEKQNRLDIIRNRIGQASRR